LPKFFNNIPKYRKKIKKHIDGKNVDVVNSYDLAIEVLFYRSDDDKSEDEEDEEVEDGDGDGDADGDGDGDGDEEDDDDDFDEQWKCVKEIKIEKQVIEFEQEETITTDIENSDLEEEATETVVADMEHSGT
jgi:hypothetical protein